MTDKGRVNSHRTDLGSLVPESVLDLQHQLLGLKRLVRHAWKHFSEDRCFEEAASLGYTSLLAMVPLFAVIFGIIAAFPVFSHWSEQLKSFIFTNFIPASGEQIQDYLNNFLASTGGLALPGTVFLIITALLLMLRIEQAFNRIWRVDLSRGVVNRIVMYWAVLTLGPLLIGTALAISVQNVFDPLGLGSVAVGLGQKGGIFFLYWAMFTLMFVLVPNRKVLFRHALAGALLSTILFELAKAGFVTYISHANYTVIYGALATIPIFLFWLYLVWTVILFGASLAASLTTFPDSERDQAQWPARLDFQMAYRLVGHLWQAQRRGENRSDIELLALEPNCHERQLQHLLHQLEETRIVARDEGGVWRLARDMEELTLGDLYSGGSFHLPVGSAEPVVINSPWDSTFSTAMHEVEQTGLAGLKKPLRGMYLAAPQAAKS